MTKTAHDEQDVETATRFHETLKGLKLTLSEQRDWSPVRGAVASSKECQNDIWSDLHKNKQFNFQFELLKTCETTFCCPCDSINARAT